jgi:predicted metal-binding membrane protein
MPSSPAFPSPPLPRRDRITILSALIAVSVLAWAYVLYLWATMPGMHAMAPADVIQLQPWTPLDFMLMVVMWAIMMVGMMLPSAAPMTLLYGGMVRKAERQGTPMAPIASFVSGYLAMWGLFSVGATLVQWGLHEAAMLSSMMMAKSQVLGATLLIVAGVYQLTPWKTVCLDHCRSPVHFISEHWRPGASGAFRLGLYHGAFCLGCCWALMGLLFVGGVMNLLWIAAIAIFVFLEKVLPVSNWSVRVGWFGGIGLIVSGLGLLWFGKGA